MNEARVLNGNITWRKVRPSKSSFIARPLVGIAIGDAVRVSNEIPKVATRPVRWSSVKLKAGVLGWARVCVVHGAAPAGRQAWSKNAAQRAAAIRMFMWRVYPIK